MLRKIYLNELIDQNFPRDKKLQEGVITAITGFNDYPNVDKNELRKNT